MIQDPVAFYVTGGTIPPGAPSYAERAADKELLAALQRSELCYVLNARQMGKSSLSVRTRQALEATGTKTAFLDLQKFGSSATAEQWYRALLERIGNDLKLRPQFLTYWRDNAELPPLTRVFGALREVALAHCEGNLVVFLDEIDVVRDLSFKTDEFFGAIRESHNARAETPELKRLTFCIIGTVAPTDLIRDVRLSPFNIGTRVKLADFTAKEAAPLAAPLLGGTKTLGQVLWWTSGHPYLTQRLCAELSKASSTDVDGMVARLFFSKSDADVDENIKNVRNGILRMGGDGAGFDRVDLLTRYGQIVSGKRVADDDTDGVCTALRLSSLVTTSEGVLRVRNRVYAKLFDAAWVRDNLPDAELRRQKAAVSRARRQIGSIAAGVLLAMGTLTVWALSERTKALASTVAERIAKTQAARREQDALLSARAESKAKLEAQAERTKALASAQSERVAKNQALIAKNQAQAALKGQITAKAAAQEQARRADQQSVIAQTSAATANRLAYIANSNLAQGAIEGKNYGLAQQYLGDMGQLLKGSTRLEAGFEWFYLNKLMHLEQLELKGHRDTVTSVSFSPDGRRVVTGSEDKTARVWDAATGRETLKLEGHTEGVLSVAFSPDGKHILTGSGTPGSSEGDKTARVWDAATGRETLQLKGHLRGVTSVSFSPDGKRIVTGSYDKTARVWDAVTGQETLSLKGHSGIVYFVSFSPDGKRIVTGSYDKTARVWDAVTGQETVQLKGHDTVVTSVSFSPNGKRIVTGSYDKTARVWDAVTGRETRQLKGHSDYVDSVAFSPDGKRIATGSHDKTARVWDAITGQETLKLEGHSSFIDSVAFSPDGKRIVTGSYDKTARVWDAVTGRESLPLKGHEVSVESVAFSRDGTRIVTGSVDSTARVWDAATGREVLQLRGHRELVTSVGFSPDGKHIVTGSVDSTARVWDASTGQETLKLEGHRNDVVSVAFSSDGKRLVTGSYDKTARVWDAATGKETLTLTGNSSWITSVSFSPNGQRLVIGSYDSTAQVCDAFTGREILQLKGHRERITSVAFSRDGKRIVTGSVDSTARVWDAATGRETLTLTGNGSWITSVSFSPDGQRLVTGSGSPGSLGGDFTARVWDKVTDTQIAEMEKQEQERLNQEAFFQRAKELSSVPLTELSSRAKALLAQHPGALTQVANKLNEIAWGLVDPTKVHPTPELARQARDIAELARQLTKEKDGTILDTLAAAYFACGDLESALATQRKAVKRLPNDKATGDGMKAMLAHYEKLWSERHRGPK